ncbi:MAG: P-loop NTPase [Pseudomonadota bacterium]
MPSALPPMDELASVSFDQSSSLTSAAKPRAAALSRLKVMGAGRWHAPLGGRPGARFIAVRGNAGVGKSTVAANLAIALAGLRSRVVLIDLDFRNPTQHEMFGIAAPVHGLKALLHERIDTMEQALTPTSVRNLYIVSAEGTSPEAASPTVEQQRRLLEQIWDLDADIVVGDLGPDAGEELVDLFELGALRLFVAAPEPRSIRRTYNFFREQVIREIEHVAGGTSEGNRVIAGLSAVSGARPMGEILAQAAGKPNVREAIAQALAAFTGRLIGNRVRNADQADLLHASARLMAEFLGISVPVLGVVESSVLVDATRISGRPLLLGSGIDRNVRLFHSMAEQLLMDSADAEAPHCVARATPAVERAGRGPLISPRDTTGDARETDGDDDDPRATGQGDDGVPLPASLGSYMRRHPRHSVDWVASYRSNTGHQAPVRIFELSISGASIETLPGLRVGDRGRLAFTQIAHQPEIDVTVMDARRPLGRAGLRFDGAEEVCARLAAIAAASSSR